MAGSSASYLGQAFARRILQLGLLTVTLFSFHVSALNFVAGSKCESVCSDKNAGTIHDDVRCLDNEYDSAPALNLKECVECQLNSTAVDPTTKVTDVQWALFHLRYTLSNCMFGFPEERVSISSPCQVSCAPLSRAVSFGIPNSTTMTNYSADLGFCTGGQFDDFTINNCAFCYSFIPQQLILGNFLQALHFACHTAPTVGKTFYPDGVTIFNQSAIQGPTTDSGSGTGNALSGTKLILAIVLPVVAGLLILIGLCCCCFHFSRRRRMQMAANSHMSRYYDGQDVVQVHPQDFSPMSPLPMTPKTSPPQQYTTWTQPPTEMDSISVVPRPADTKMAQSRTTEIAELPVTKSSPSYPQSRWPQDSKDGSSEPLNSPDRASYGNTDDTNTVISDLKESERPQYDNRGSPPIDTFRAQDGFVTEHTHGTTKQ